MSTMFDQCYQQMKKQRDDEREIIQRLHRNPVRVCKGVLEEEYGKYEHTTYAYYDYDKVFFLEVIPGEDEVREMVVEFPRDKSTCEVWLRYAARDIISVSGSYYTLTCVYDPSVNKFVFDHVYDHPRVYNAILEAVEDEGVKKKIAALINAKRIESQIITCYDFEATRKHLSQYIEELRAEDDVDTVFIKQCMEMERDLCREIEMYIMYQTLFN